MNRVSLTRLHRDHRLSTDRNPQAQSNSPFSVQLHHGGWNACHRYPNPMYCALWPFPGSLGSSRVSRLPLIQKSWNQCYGPCFLSMYRTDSSIFTRPRTCLGLHYLCCFFTSILSWYIPLPWSVYNAAIGIRTTTSASSLLKSLLEHSLAREGIISTAMSEGKQKLGANVKKIESLSDFTKHDSLLEPYDKEFERKTMWDCLN